MGVYKKIRKDGTVAWFYDFMLKGKRYRGVGGTTRTQATRVQERVRDDVLSGRFKLVKHKNSPLLKEFIPKYLDRKKQLRSWKRIEICTRNLLGFFKNYDLSTITPSMIEDYKIHRKDEGLSNATVNRELGVLKNIYNLAIKWGEVTMNPVVDVDFLEEPPGRTRYLKPEEARKLIDLATPHMRPVLITALNTGMRLSEILNLKWDDVHLENIAEPYIEILVTKNNKRRIIPLNDVMIELLIRMRKHRSENPHVFLSSTGDRYHHVTHVFQSLLKRAGFQNFRFHDLRHTFASHFIMSGGDILALKEILGHSSMQMVLRYAHLASAYKRKQMNNLGNLFSDCHPIATSEK